MLSIYGRYACICMIFKNKLFLKIDDTKTNFEWKDKQTFNESMLLKKKYFFLCFF